MTDFHAKMEVEHVSRSVINGKLLDTLDDNGVVAVLLNERDCQLVIRALRAVPSNRPGRNNLLDGLRRLYTAAFGEASD